MILALKPRQTSDREKPQSVIRQDKLLPSDRRAAARKKALRASNNSHSVAIVTVNLHGMARSLGLMPSSWFEEQRGHRQIGPIGRF